jgi:hypothetical protein
MYAEQAPDNFKTPTFILKPWTQDKVRLVKWFVFSIPKLFYFIWKIFHSMHAG